MSVPRPLVHPAVAVLVAAGLTGCSASGPDAAHEPSVLVEKNRLMWVMPLDAYMVAEQLDTAVDVFIEPCMQERGFAYRRPPVDVTKRSETVSVSGRNLFNVEVARQWGYGGAPDPNADVLRADAAESVHWSAEQTDRYEDCLGRAREQFPAQRINNVVTSLSFSAWSGAKNAPEVLDAAERWVQCMQPLGFSDLPDGPNADGGGTPTPAMTEAYTGVPYNATFDGAAPEQTAEQKAEEIRIATFDAECQESTGYAQALYDAEWDRQVSVVRENEDTLTRLLDEKAAYEEKADRVLREAGSG
ncbi:hypothetical protein FA014_04020 [Cellulomonas hominis]|uniref:Lipoprotein n=1 Tax=Cellulomonas hominis TaxID=156981 RepID=A0A7Z8NRK2_9CELL|nr:hypothetical protein [Cellulomonas hominis]TKR26758.1 hypothetical protein FA014_04020 [Cellulomonas hominis]